MTIAQPTQSSSERRAARMLHGIDERFFTVIVGPESFALPVACVSTIFRIDVVTPIPLSPPEIEGLVNLRGRIVTAVSLRKRLAMQSEERFDGALAIGIEHRGEHFALIVDDVGDVVELNRADRIAVPPHVAAGRRKLTEALYRNRDGILPVLDMEAVFAFAHPRAAP